MDIQAGSYAGPYDLARMIGEIPGNGQHWVWSGPSGLSGHFDGRCVTGTVQYNIFHVFRWFESVANPSVGEKGIRWAFLAYGFYSRFHRRDYAKPFVNFRPYRVLGISGDGHSQDDENRSHDDQQLNECKATGSGMNFQIYD